MEKAEVIHKGKNKPCEARLIFILDVEKFVEKVWWKCGIKKIKENWEKR